MTRGLWQPIRISLLAAVLGGTLLVLVKAIWLSTAASTSSTVAAPDSLPSALALSGWQLVKTVDIKPEPGLPIGRQYQYRQNATVLDIQMRYVMGDGDVSRFLLMYTPLKTASSTLQVRHRPDIGFYGVLSYQGQVYLSACINPRGATTVTEQQFSQNRYTYDLTISRLWPWIINQEPLIDRRCLWTLMSVPLPPGKVAATSEAAYRTLEAAWGSWYPWWQANFLPSRQ